MAGDEAARMMGHDQLPVGWDVFPIMRCGEISGFFLFNGDEMHAWRRPEYSGRWITAREIALAGSDIMRKYGHIKTSVAEGNEVGIKFVTRLGFTETHRGNGLIYYISRKLNHARF